MIATLQRVLAAPLFAAVLASGCATAQEPEPAHPYAAVLERYAEAIRNEDLDAMEAETLGHTRFTIIEGRGANWSWTEYREDHLTPEFESERFHIEDYQISDVRPYEGTDLGYALFEFAITGTLDGEPYEREGRGTAVFEETAEGWKICHLQTS